MAEPLIYSDTGAHHLPLLFFMHGWPDTGALWQKQVEFFSTRYRCVCITLPAFAPDDNSPGADSPQLVERLFATIQSVRGDSKQKLILVGHDWGAFLTYLLDRDHPTLADGLITMDVGAVFQPSSLGHLCFIISYQWWLASAYGLGKWLPSLGNAMTRRFSKLAQAPRRDQVYSKMNYFYFYFWRAKFLKKYQRSLPISYRLSKPILYLYGLKKKYHFHSPRWETIVKKNPGSEVVGLPNCDHWLMVRDPDTTNQLMEKWLRQTL